MNMSNVQCDELFIKEKLPFGHRTFDQEIK